MSASRSSMFLKDGSPELSTSPTSFLRTMSVKLPCDGHPLLSQDYGTSPIAFMSSLRKLEGTLWENRPCFRVMARLMAAIWFLMLAALHRSLQKSNWYITSLDRSSFWLQSFSCRYSHFHVKAWFLQIKNFCVPFYCQKNKCSWLRLADPAGCYWQSLLKLFILAILMLWHTDIWTLLTPPWQPLMACGTSADADLSMSAVFPYSWCVAHAPLVTHPDVHGEWLRL